MRLLLLAIILIGCKMPKDSVIQYHVRAHYAYFYDTKLSEIGVNTFHFSDTLVIQNNSLFSVERVSSPEEGVISYWTKTAYFELNTKKGTIDTYNREPEDRIKKYKSFSNLRYD